MLILRGGLVAVGEVGVESIRAVTEDDVEMRCFRGVQMVFATL